MLLDVAGAAVAVGVALLGFVVVVVVCIVVLRLLSVVLPPPRGALADPASTADEAPDEPAPGDAVEAQAAGAAEHSGESDTASDSGDRRPSAGEGSEQG